MKIALVHSFYSQNVASGENAAVMAASEALASAGHEVRIISRSTDDHSQQRLRYATRSGLTVATGFGPSPDRELDAFGPDVVHVHNLFPNFGTNWIQRWSNRLVTTIHNFRPLCANGLLFRNGQNCFECLEGSNLSALQHRCYRDSTLATLPLVLRSLRGVNRNPLLSRSRRIIFLSKLAQQIYEEAGLAEDKNIVIPNGISSASRMASSASNGRWLTIGRLSPEKGILELAEIWPRSEQLDVIGSGEQHSRISDLSNAYVSLLGSFERAETRRILSDYEGLIFPSKCLEMQPTVVLEAMSAGIPVVALSGNAGAKVVQEADAGFVYDDSKSLERALIEVRENRLELGARAAAYFENNFTQKSWLTSITALYESLS